MSANMESEFPKALNLGLKSGSGTSSLADFSVFSRDALAGQNVRLRSLWLVAEPYGSDLLVTVGNFMGENLSVNVTVEGESRSIYVHENSTEIAVFSGVPDSFQMAVQFPGHSRTGTWAREKVNLYAFMELAMGSDAVVEEIEA